MTKSWGCVCCEKETSLRRWASKYKQNLVSLRLPSWQRGIQYISAWELKKQRGRLSTDSHSTCDPLDKTCFYCKENPPHSHIVCRLILSAPKQWKKKNQKNLQWMYLILGITFSRVDFDKFYLQILYPFCSPLMICKSSNQEIWGFPSCSPGIFNGKWPSQAAGKGNSGLSAMVLCMCSCTAACNAAQRRGDLVKFVNRNISSVSAERTHVPMTQAALIAVLAVCQTFFISSFI